MKDGDLSNTFSPVVLIFWCAVHEIFTFEGYTRLNIWTISENHIICHVEDNMTHPFRTTDHPDEHLVNISSGVIASKDIQKSLLSVHDLGKRQMEEYITESLCTGGQRSMYQPIPKSKLKTFSISKKKTKILILGQKAWLQSTRKWFSAVLCY